MSREAENDFSPASQEITNNISKVTIEQEKPYGIYLPNWKSVVKAIHTFARGTFPVSQEEVMQELAFRSTEGSDGFFTIIRVE